MKNLIVVLSIHLFSVQTKLLFLLNGGVDFSYLNLTETTITAMIFSLSYAIATAIIIYKSSNKNLILSYAILDGLAVLLYYFIKIPIEVSAFYFAIYTFFIIASTLSISKQKDEKFSQRKLSEELGVSESKMSRAIKKINN